MVSSMLRETISAHGPITVALIPSATKRLVGQLKETLAHLEQEREGLIQAAANHASYGDELLVKWKVAEDRAVQAERALAEAQAELVKLAPHDVEVRQANARANAAEDGEKEARDSVTALTERLEMAMYNAHLFLPGEHSGGLDWKVCHLPLCRDSAAVLASLPASVQAERTRREKLVGVLRELADRYFEAHESREWPSAVEALRPYYAAKALLADGA